MKTAHLLLTALLLSVTLTGCSGNEIKGRYWYFVDNVVMEGQEQPEIRLWAALPIERRGQGVKIKAIHPQPVEIIRDSLGGNRIVFWQEKDLQEGRQLIFYYDFEVSPEEVNTKVDPGNIRPYLRESAEFTRYTRPEPWIEITPEIRTMAQVIAGQEGDPNARARKIFDWVVDNIRYEYPDTTQRGAAKSFRRRKGDCGEYAFVFIAMCRAVGIPARFVACNWIQSPAGHAWAEFLLPPYGWIPVDASMADAVISGSGGVPKERMRRWLRETQGIDANDSDYFFGNLYPSRLIVCVGNNIEVASQLTGIRRTFKVLQPGGSAAIPPGIEFIGLSEKAVHGGFFMFGDSRDDLDLAREKAKKELANSYLRAELCSQAEQGFVMRLREYGQDAVSLYGLGRVHMKKKDHDAAIEIFQKCLAGDAGSATPIYRALAHTSLGYCYDVKGMRERALREYRIVIDMDVNFSGVIDSATKYLHKPYQESP